MADTTTQQEFRRQQLIDLAATFHRSKCGDYEDTYAEFAAEYGIPGYESEDDICDECGDYRSAKVHTDTELHPDDAVDGLTLHPFDAGEVKPIPRYASCAEDETYGMIHLFDSLKEALEDQAGIPSNGEYLNVPAGIYDLDQEVRGGSRGRIETRLVMLTIEQTQEVAAALRAWGELQGDPDAAANLRGLAEFFDYEG